MSSYECMLLDIKNHVATVTVNRPGGMNALNWQAYAELEQIFREYGEERFARKVSRAIVRDRPRRFETTVELAEFISRLIPRR